jgi:ubiquinone biosynthesis protein COQ9
MKKGSKRQTGTGDSRRRKVLEAILAQVPFDGWTGLAYEATLKQSGLSPSDAALLFPRGIYDVVDAFGTMADEAMLDCISTQRGFADFRIRDKIGFAVRARLEFLTPRREAMRRLMIWYAMPHHWPLGLKRIYRTVDLIWRAAGDVSTDFNFYTKRGLLAGVLKTTLLFWLDDDTPGCSASWEFLERRIAEVLRIGQSLGKLRA